MIQNTEWTREQLRNANERLDGSSPREVLEWAFDMFVPEIALASSFGPSGLVLIHLVSQVRPETTIFYLDTHLLFEETYALRDRLQERLPVTFTQVQPALTLLEQEITFAPALWEREPDRCCNLRKVQPLHRFLSDKRAWITGIRRDQSSTRAAIEVVEWDRTNGLIKVNPLAHWTEEEVWGYIHLYDLPYNKLHDRNYPSIGCIPCTAPVPPGQDIRAGRWAGRSKTECGIHLQFNEAR